MVNYLAVLVAGLASLALGFLWYSKILFGKVWMEMAGVEDVKPEKGVMMKNGLAGLITSLVTAYVLAWFLEMSAITSLGGGLFIGFLAWLGFQGSLTLGSVLWEKKPVNLYLLNNAFNLVSMLLTALILTLWA